MPDEHSSQLPSHPIRCPVCRYDLRGTESVACPECGRPRIWRLVTCNNLAEYTAVRQTLLDAGVPHEEYLHFGGLEGATALVGGGEERFVLGIGLPQLAAASEALAQADLPLPLLIIERGNPFCDVCSANLSAVSNGICPRCNSEFTWDDELDFGQAEDSDASELT